MLSGGCERRAAVLPQQCVQSDVAEAYPRGATQIWPYQLLLSAQKKRNQEQTVVLNGKALFKPPEL